MRLPVSIFIFSLLLTLSLWSCGGSSGTQGTEAQPEVRSSQDEVTFSEADPIPLTAGIPDDEPVCDQDQSGALPYLNEQRLDGSGTFPYVYQGVGRSNLLEAYSMQFQLCYDKLLVPLPNTRVPWINPELYNENNGNFITYVRQGREIGMSSPHIMVQYLNKGLPYCSSVDSVFMWLDQTFLADPTSEVITEATAIETFSGKKAYCKEYYIGKGDGRRLPKWVSYAYVDFNQEYLIGMALTTTVKTDFPINRPLFYKLVRSLNYY